ncbi:MAG: galactose oxidase-like domain-containing protein [Ignavibacteria bacterium]
MSVVFGEFNEGPADSKVTAVHAVLDHTGKVLIFHCRSYPMWTWYYDPELDEMVGSHLDVPIWPVATEPRPIEPSRIFCSGHCFMSDGRLIVAGGEKDTPYPYQYIAPAFQPFRGLDYCFIFDPEGDPQWIVPLDGFDNPYYMRDGRWYPSLTILNDGRILALGGKRIELDACYESQDNIIPEYFESDTGWHTFSDIVISPWVPGDIRYYYPASHLVPTGDFAGKVFVSETQPIPTINPDPCPFLIYGEPGETQVFDPDQTGEDPYWQPVGGQRNTPSQYSNHVLLPIRLAPYRSSRIIVIGGLWGSVLDKVEMIDLSDSTPGWILLDNMATPRTNHNSIILPDRKILVIGGDNLSGPCNIPELLDTDTLTWIQDSIFPAPVMDIHRGYHSTALLLPNGKVFLGGGRVEDGGDVENDTERRITIFTPGYLLDGDQPVITDAPTEVTYNENFEVTLDGEYGVGSMAFIKPMSVTHGYNSEQRYIELAFTGISSGVYSVTAPADSNIAPPGYYMLFVLKDDRESTSGESKIPSKAVFIKLTLT